MTFFVRPALTDRSPHRPQPTTPRQTTRAVAPITTRRRATTCAARVRDTDFSSRHRLGVFFSGLVSEGSTVSRTVSVHGPVALSLLTRPRAVEEDVGSPPLFTVGSPRRPRPTTTTRPRMIARTATTTQRTHTALTTPTVTPSAQNQILSRHVSGTAQSRPPRHRRDASAMAWRRGLSPLDSARATAFSPRKDSVKNYRTRPTHRFARRLCGG